MQESVFEVETIDAHDGLIHMSITDKKTGTVVYGYGNVYHNVFNRLEEELKEKLKKEGNNAI